MRVFFDWMSTVIASDAFQNAFWLFLGVVFGALIQHFLNRLTFRRQTKDAKAVLDVEIELNLEELAKFKERLEWLKSRIQAGQAQEDELYFLMNGFDYSIVAPLVQAGYFHKMLGARATKSYFEFMKFFNNENCKVVNQQLAIEHENQRSLNFLDFIDHRYRELGSGLAAIQRAKLRRGQLFFLPQ